MVGFILSYIFIEVTLEKVIFIYLHLVRRYEDDPILGHRMYRDIRQVEVTKMKAKGARSVPPLSYQWETIATNLDEFQEVSVSLCIGGYF